MSVTERLLHREMQNHTDASHAGESKNGHAFADIARDIWSGAANQFNKMGEQLGKAEGTIGDRLQAWGGAIANEASNLLPHMELTGGEQQNNDVVITGVNGPAVVAPDNGDETAAERLQENQSFWHTFARTFTQTDLGTHSYANEAQGGFHSHITQGPGFYPEGGAGGS